VTEMTVILVCWWVGHPAYECARYRTTEECRDKAPLVIIAEKLAASSAEQLVWYCEDRSNK